MCLCSSRHMDQGQPVLCSRQSQQPGQYYKINYEYFHVGNSSICHGTTVSLVFPLPVSLWMKATGSPGTCFVSRAATTKLKCGLSNVDNGTGASGEICNLLPAPRGTRWGSLPCRTKQGFSWLNVRRQPLPRWRWRGPRPTLKPFSPISPP